MRHFVFNYDQDLKKLVNLIKCGRRFLLSSKGPENKHCGILVSSQEVRQLYYCYIKNVILIPQPRPWRIGEKWTDLELRSY